MFLFFGSSVFGCVRLAMDDIRVGIDQMENIAILGTGNCMSRRVWGILRDLNTVSMPNQR